MSRCRSDWQKELMLWVTSRLLCKTTEPVSTLKEPEMCTQKKNQDHQVGLETIQIYSTGRTLRSDVINLKLRTPQHVYSHFLNHSSLLSFVPFQQPKTFCCVKQQTAKARKIKYSHNIATCCISGNTSFYFFLPGFSVSCSAAVCCQWGWKCGLFIPLSQCNAELLTSPSARRWQMATRLPSSLNAITFMILVVSFWAEGDGWTSAALQVFPLS